MIVIGLTGSIGMGKTTVAGMLEEMNCPVHNADRAVHEALQFNQDIISQISSLFPGAVCQENGSIQRELLGKIIFNDHEKRMKLEAILHPIVRQSQDQFVQLQKENGLKVVVLDIPLLFETGAQERVDHVLVVSAPLEMQRQRVLKRSNMSEEKFNAILKIQMSDKEKRKLADFVIPTGGNKEETKNFLKATIKQIKGGAL